MIEFTIPNLIDGAYIGNDFSYGQLPALFYFSLSCRDSLLLPPYNSPVTELQNPSLRIFSFTIPGHDEGQDKFRAMAYWRENECILAEFFETVSKAVDWLIKNEIVDPKKMALCGLSRGGYIALQIAKREKRFSTLLAFAPVTDLSVLEEFQKKEIVCEPFNPDDFLSLSHIRFYIGNRDTRVSTDASYFFIRKLADIIHEKRVKTCKAELFITHSIGYQGHGTSAETFKEGSQWLKSHL